MKAMQCDRAAELIGAYLDQELDGESRRDVAAHLGHCRSCSAQADRLWSMGRQLAALHREPAPEQLAQRVRAGLAEIANEAVAQPHLAAFGGGVRRAWLPWAAVLVVACGMTAGITVFLTSRMDAVATLERDIAAAHVRSLLQDSPLQVASSDVHTIKPWFAGRLDFAPAVRDLAADGFPLAGARLDFIDGRRVAALVYHRRLHVANVFLWPSADASDSPAHERVQRGYNVVSWRKNGIVYWAISDLNMTELRLLRDLL